MKDNISISAYELYRQSIERMPVHIYWKDKNFQYINCNLLQANDVGFNSIDEIIGKTDYDIFDKSTADVIRKNDLEVITIGKACLFEEPCFGHNSREKIFFLTQKIPLLNDNGEIIGVIGISFNITERKKHEEKIINEKKEVERTLASIIDNLPGHVFWKNKDGVFQGCNLLQAKSAGFTSKSQMIGKTDYEMPWRNEAHILRESDLSVMNSHETLTREEASKLANSNHVSIFLSKKTPLYGESGEVVGILGISFDITDRKNMEEELLKSKEAAEAANIAKSEFIRNMEHQLRTPFSGVYSMVEFLALDETDAKKKELLEITYQSAKEFLELLNDIIEFCRNQTESTIILDKKFNLRTLIEKTITMQRAAATSKNLKLKQVYPANIPSIWISDPKRIQRIILNLLSNAIKFSSKGAITVKVKLAKNIDKKSSIIQFFVTDMGIGIHEDKQDLIYEKFYRVSPANHNKYTGAGLGLHVVKELINDLEGEIEVKSSVNKGTTFICTIPLKRPLIDDIFSDD